MQSVKEMANKLRQNGMQPSTTTSQSECGTVEQRHVAALFARFGDIYGAIWCSRFATPAITDRAIAEWARQLKGLTPDEIRRGLDNLPDKPPSAPEFRNACRRYATQAHRPFQKALPVPCHREVGENALAGLKRLVLKQK